MRKAILLLVLILVASPMVFAQAKKATPTKPAPAKPVSKPIAKPADEPASKTAASRFTISPKLSYVGYLGLGVEFSPLYKITKDVDLMGEVNYDFWSAAGGYGYLYGEINAVYNLQPVVQPDRTFNPYVGGGILYGLPFGTPTGGTGNFSGGIGFALFGGVTTQFDPYTVYAQLKYANGPISYNWPGVPGWIAPWTETWNALGLGMEFGLRMPI